MKNDEYYIDLISKIKKRRKRRLLTFEALKKWLNKDLERKFEVRCENLDNIRTLLLEQTNLTPPEIVEGIKQVLNMDYEDIWEYYHKFTPENEKGYERYLY